MVLGLATARMFTVLATEQHENNATKSSEYNYNRLVMIVIMPDASALDI